MNLSYKFFTIPIQAMEDKEEELNQFIQTHKIINIQKEFTSHTNQSFWCISIEYVRENTSQ
ncbi:MAG: hypothetical protein HQK75_14665 [Candidatus Magnetomorum sp.]|nr:hypothetical protein [Candidatus Magnetomorum sp.]